MHINFAMWRKASWQLIKMDDKKEWDALDVVSKWLIATRSAVTLVTVYSCVIAGLLAWRDGYFSWLPFIILDSGPLHCARHQQYPERLHRLLARRG